MIKKTCPYCGGASFSSYDDPQWRCPYCNELIGDAEEKEKEEYPENRKNS